jgi:hypothetical protein
LQCLQSPVAENFPYARYLNGNAAFNELHHGF